MSTAVAPTEERTSLSQPESTYLYVSARRGLRLVKKAVRPIRNQMGEEVDATVGERLDFSYDSVLRVPIDRSVEVELPTGATLTAGEINEWLQKHKSYGDREDGFWLVDQVAPPITRAELDTVLEMALKLDEQGLTDLIAAEEAGFAREDLIGAAKGALAKLHEMQAAAQAQQKSKPGPKPKDPGVNAS